MANVAVNHRRQARRRCRTKGAQKIVRITNPSQLFSLLGPFNPQQRHRYQRILRRHVTLIDFLWRAILSPRSWVEQDESTVMELKSKAMDLWFND